MPLLYPTQRTLHDVFSVTFPLEATSNRSVPLQRTRYQSRSDLYPAWSVIDDAKSKASALSAEAAREYEKASAMAQEKTGKIELYSAKYYASCTFGGLLACV
jgi:solute carrier family 25 phosphate transporter 3